MKQTGRFLCAVFLLSLLFTACAGQVEEEPETTAAETTSEIATFTTQPEQSTTSSAGESTAQSSQTQTTQQKSVSVTIPEGFTFWQVAERLEANGICTAQAFYEAAQNYEVQSFSVPSSSDRAFKMEGYLFPDTYTFYEGEDPVSVLRKMLNNYAAKSGMPDNKTLILASIIEKEARTDGNMRMVSSVFHNRLDQGMQLQADSTREYVNNNITGNSLLGSTDKYAALYNTYKCAGLPAGPICNPGKRAIEAAMNPSSSEYLYFFFGNDNENHYSKTLAEHEQKMAEIGVQYE